MSAVELLLELRARNIDVDALDGHVRCRHAPGALPSELADRVRAKRLEVLALLADPDELREAAARAVFGADADGGAHTPAPAGRGTTDRCFACGGARFAPDGVCLACHPGPGAGDEGAAR